MGKTVKDIMNPIEEYDKVDLKAALCDALAILKRKYAKASETHLARAVSSRALEAAEQAGEMLERFRWIHNSFEELVKQEAHKKVKDIMSQAEPVLKEDDLMNHAVFVLFKDGVRQQLVERDGKIVGVVNLYVVLTELMEAVGPECHVNWEA